MQAAQGGAAEQADEQQAEEDLLDCTAGHQGQDRPEKDAGDYLHAVTLAAQAATDFPHVRGRYRLAAGIGQQQALGPRQQGSQGCANAGVHARVILAALQFLEHLGPRHPGAAVTRQVLEAVEHAVEQRAVDQLVFLQHLARRAHRLALDQAVAKRFEPGIRAGQGRDAPQQAAMLFGVQARVVIENGAQHHHAQYVIIEGVRVVFQAGVQFQVAGQLGAVQGLLHRRQALADKALQRVVVIQPAEQAIDVALLALQA
ncbi:hypothetical protein D3C80_1326160 [compost metagenome]